MAATEEALPANDYLMFQCKTVMLRAHEVCCVLIEWGNAQQYVMWPQEGAKHSDYFLFSHNAKNYPGFSQQLYSTRLSIQDYQYTIIQSNNIFDYAMTLNLYSLDSKIRM